MNQGMGFQGFDWDEGNLDKSLKKHGMSRGQIEGMFARPVVFRESPSSGEDGEKRFIAVGSAENGKPMLVAFTFRTQDGKVLLRPISARHMHAKEAESYEPHKEND